MHKYLDHSKYPKANTINYMSFFTNDFTFAGFIPAPNEQFGTYIDDVHMVAIHKSNKPIKVQYSDDGIKEKQQILSGKLWLVVLYGSDNSSYMKRFDSQECMNKWIEKTTALHRDDSWLWYNS